MSISPFTPPYQIKEEDLVSPDIVNRPVNELYGMVETIRTTLNKKIIATPIILSPSEGATVSVMWGQLTVTSSDFSNQDDQDGHAHTDWLLTSDVGGTNIVASDMDTTDFTSHTFKHLNLTNGATYYIFCRYRGFRASYSEWSAPRAIVASVSLIAPSGRKLYRNATNSGTVVECTIRGTRVTYVVADAAYRYTAAWSMDYNVTTDSSLPNYAGKNRGFYPSTTGAYADPSTQAVNTDANIDAKFAAESFVETNTSKQNTDMLANQPYYGEAWLQLRDIAWPGGRLDLPKTEILYRIWCDAEALDALDPTVEANIEYALGSRNPQGYWRIGRRYFSWASTEYNAQGAWNVYYNGTVSYTLKDFVMSVVPVLEG